MMTAYWNKPGLCEKGTTAMCWIRNGIGTARLRIKDEVVFETHGGEFNTRTEWSDERTGIVDLAIVLALEAYDRGEKELHDFICGGFNTATIMEDIPSVELPASVMYEARLMVEDLEETLEWAEPILKESIEELQLDLFRTPKTGPQLELFG